MLPNIHCKMSFGNTVAKQSCPNGCQVCLSALVAGFVVTHRFQAFLLRLAVKHCCQAFLSNLADKHLQASVPCTAVKLCCSTITGQGVPLSTVVNSCQGCHHPFTSLRHSHTALCGCNLPPHLIPGMRGPASASAICLSLPECYAHVPLDKVLHRVHRVPGVALVLDAPGLWVRSTSRI